MEVQFSFYLLNKIIYYVTWRSLTVIKLYSLVYKEVLYKNEPIEAA